MPIVLLGTSHRTAPVELRERFALAESALPQILQRLRATTGADEVVILSTCNRVEIYAAAQDGADALLARLKSFLREQANQPEADDATFYALTQPQSVEHLFKVASGLDSMVLGETEILGQLKKAYDLALQQKQTGPLLNKAFQRAFSVAKQIRSETNIQRGATSVAAVAVELAEKIFDTLSERHVMVIGAGETGEKTARALLSRGARSVIVSNRSHERAVALAGELGGRAVHFEEWHTEFAAVDIIISSTAAPHYVLDRQRLAPLMRLRENRPLLLVDIAVPRDIEPEVNFLENVYLYNIDDLQSIASDSLRQRQEEVARCEQIIREKAVALLAPRPKSFIPTRPAHGHC
jgi:glutamyl-tRNA reductase